LHEIGGSIADVLCRTIILGRIQLLQLLSTLSSSESDTGVAAVGSRNQTSFAQIVLGFQILHFRFVGSINNAHGDAEDRISLLLLAAVIDQTSGLLYLCLFPNRIVNYIVIRSHLLLLRIAKILQTRLLLLEVYVAQAAVKEDLARV
jgi:hypothetical protein